MSSNNNKAHEHDPVLPRTDGERHLPDGKIPSYDQLERTESEDLEVIRMMEEMGLDSSMPIDPSSLKALQELLTPKRSHGKSLKKSDDSKIPAMSNLTPQAANEQQASLSTTLRVPSEVLRPIALGRVTSDLTMGLRSESMVEEATDASTAGSTQRSNEMDKRILDQLQMQTALLLDLQRRVDELSQIVITQQGQLQQQQQQRGTIPTIVPPMYMNQQQGAAANVLPDQQQQARNAPPHQQEQPPQMMLFAIFTSIPAYIRSTRIAEICRVYWALHRRDMRGRIDLNLIIKILFMSVILLGKFSSKRKHKNHAQFHVTVFLIVGGFMWQTGYAGFLYNFFIKERYVQRIWNGEHIVVEAQAPPRFAAPQARAQQNAQQPQDDRPGLLRGGIPPAPAHAGFVGKFIMDIVYLFGSFVLSILPMWKAEARQQGDDNQRPAEGQENEGDDGNDGGMQG